MSSRGNSTRYYHHINFRFDGSFESRHNIFAEKGIDIDFLNEWILESRLLYDPDPFASCRCKLCSGGKMWHLHNLDQLNVHMRDMYASLARNFI